MVDAIGKIIEITESPPPNGSEFIKVRSPQFMQNVQKVTQFEPENKCPGCVLLKLELKPIETPTLNPFKKEVKSLELFLALNFSLQKEKILGGTIEFGIKRGTLEITLENCISPFNHRSFVKKLETQIVVDTEIKEVKTNKRLSSVSITLEEFIKAQLGFESQNGKEKTQKFKTTKCQVYAENSSDYKPSWNFGVEDDNPCLIGAIQEILAKLEVNGNPCKIEARFVVASKNIYVENLEGIPLKIIGRNKESIGEAAVIRRLVLNSKTQPYLSKQEITYG